ncbi:hypothetical protein FRC00_002195 [Tulasnella sp. 408]|nr:hypothetical protein FRC00_002195 [Tulasnella sp. 408]
MTAKEKLKFAWPEALQVDQGVPQTGFIHSEVHESKTTVGPRAEAISFPPRPDNTGQNQSWNEEGRPVNRGKARNTDLSVRSLPAFTGMPPAVVQPIDPTRKSPLPSKRPRSQSLHRLSLNELRDGLLSTSGKSSKKLDALDCTGRLRERTKTKFPGGFSDVSQAKLGDRVVAVKALRATNADPLDELRIRKRLAREIYVRQIAEGLKYLHIQTPPVIHGDFKTANVLVTDEQIPKICDFGSSKRVGGVETVFATTNLHSTTIRYSAPEILQEDEHDTLSLLTDVYAFACVALETMTDKCPFWKIKKDIAVINQVLYKKQTPSQEDHPSLEDPALWDLLRRCWKCEPSERPTMIEVCKKLGAVGYGPSAGFYLTIPEGATQPGIA